MPSFILYIISLLGVIVCVQSAAPTDSCARFWPTLSPGDEDTIDDTCTTWPGFPRTFGTTTVYAAYTEYWRPSLSVLDPILNAALDQSFATYVPLVTANGDYMPDIAIIFAAEIDENNIAVTTVPTLTGPCQIKVFDLIARYMNTSPKQASQILSHEVFHCIQDRKLGDVSHVVGGAQQWVIEGSATYFSNLVFPEADWEHGWEKSYDPTSPIYQQNYQSSLFFQTLEWTKGVSYIYKWTMDTVFEAAPATTNEERARLANLPDFLSEFYLFAKQFSIHSPFSSSATSSILDTDGDFIYVEKAIIPTPVSLTMTNDNGTSGTVDLRAVPFTITVFSLPLDPGQIVTVSAAISPSDRVAYRLQKDAVWADMPDFEGEHTKGFIVIGCDDPDIVLDILYVSGADADSSAVSIYIDQFYKYDSDTCKCKTGVRGLGLQDCTPTTPTSTPSPTSSTTSTPTSRSASNTPKPTPTGTGSCKNSNIPTDSCLTGKTWNLDLPSMKALMEEKLKGKQSVTSLSLSGSGTLVINGTEAEFIYDNLQIVMTLQDIGVVTTVINGNFDSNIFTQSAADGSGAVCLVVTHGAGTAVISNPLIGETSFDMGAASGGWISPDWEIQYTCAGGQLSMQGFANGVGAWGPYAYTS